MMLSRLAPPVPIEIAPLAEDKLTTPPTPPTPFALVPPEAVIRLAPAALSKNVMPLGAVIEILPAAPAIVPVAVLAPPLLTYVLPLAAVVNVPEALTIMFPPLPAAAPAVETAPVVM